MHSIGQTTSKLCRGLYAVMYACVDQTSERARASVVARVPAADSRATQRVYRYRHIDSTA